MKIPLLLNYAQCRLLKKDYYAVIEHCNEILLLDPNNVKALFRRAKAHFGAWNPEEAKKDFQKAADLDKSLQASVKSELEKIEDVKRLHNIEDKLRFQKLF